MSDAMHQMTLEYAEAEDRLLFKLSTQARQEFRLWLTRRVVRELWALLLGVFEGAPEIAVQPAADVKQAMMSIRHREAVEEGDFATRHETAKPHPTVRRPLLVSRVYVTEGADAPRLGFQTRAGQTVNLTLTDEIAHALGHLLQSAVVAADWDLRLSVGDAVRTLPGERAKVH